jgi:hypothetical protein
MGRNLYEAILKILDLRGVRDIEILILAIGVLLLSFFVVNLRVQCGERLLIANPPGQIKLSKPIMRSVRLCCIL